MRKKTKQENKKTYVYEWKYGSKKACVEFSISLFHYPTRDLQGSLKLMEQSYY